jgi:hypothetical protein
LLNNSAMFRTYMKRSVSDHEYRVLTNGSEQEL